MRAFLSLPILLLVALTACGSQQGWPLDTVDDVNLPRFMGTWFEIGAYPNAMEMGCKNTRSEYVPHANDTTSFVVINTCERAGRQVEQRGTATVPDVNEPGKLIMTFNVPVVGPIIGEYDVIALDTDYQWTMAGHPTRDYLWIFSRAPSIDTDVLAALVVQAEDFGFVDVRKRLRCTKQGGFEKTCDAVVKR